jgi:hypothetical protein
MKAMQQQKPLDRRKYSGFTLHNLVTQPAYLVAGAVAAISHTPLPAASCHHHGRLMLSLLQAVSHEPTSNKACSVGCIIKYDLPQYKK